MSADKTLLPFSRHPQGRHLAGPVALVAAWSHCLRTNLVCELTPDLRAPMQFTRRDDSSPILSGLRRQTPLTLLPIPISGDRSKCPQLGEKHLNHLISQYVEHYLTERLHQGLDIGNELLMPMKPPDENVPSPDKLVCHERLGGLLKSYSRRAA